VRVTTTRRSSPLIPAVLVLALAAWLVGRTWTKAAPRPLAPTPASEPSASRSTDVTSGRAASPSATAPPPVSAGPPAERAPLSHGERAVNAPQQPDQRAASDADREPVFTANAPGEAAGIAAFPPPGTKPIKHGIVVPDDFELPPGYVRHYQATDDGRRLVPILMFHPDFVPVDAAGNPIALPENRVVPPELAPPGLPIRTLDETTDVDARVGRKDHTTAQP